MSQHLESFAELFEEKFGASNLAQGAVIQATIIEVRPDRITVNAGLKSDAIIQADEFSGETISVGDLIDVVVESVENGFGETRVSRKKARQAQSWIRLEKSLRDGEIVLGRVIERVKGGFTVDLSGVYAFLPGSLVDVKPIRDPGHIEGKEFEFKIIKMDQKRNNVVVSRRLVMEQEDNVGKQARLDELHEGQEIKGVVKNITDYGAFVDLGGVDGLLHITDLSYKRVQHPSQVLNVGDELTVKVLKFDRDKNRVSLGMKQLSEDPWLNIARRYPVGTRVFGRITNVTDYGCFVELEEGVEGLVHMSEMDWTNKNVHPSKIVKPFDEVEVIVLDINEDRRRISLGIKQTKANPWQEFSNLHQVGEKITGKIRSITDFGLFVGLDGEIDGLIHLSDISWTEAGETAVKKYKKGDELEAIILAIDPERERISLGVKQLEPNPAGSFLDNLAENSTVEGVIQEVEAKRAVLGLAENVSGVLPIAEYKENAKDLTEELKVGDKLKVKVINVDRKTQMITVSHKATLGGETRVKPVEMPSKATLGDLLKEQMQAKE